MDDVTPEEAAAVRQSLLVLGACAEFVVERAGQGDEAANRLLAMLHAADRRAELASLEADLSRPSYGHPTIDGSSL